ncbi:MAG: phosphoglucosamine mutase [Actinomycetota bacterium]|nr:phosphoglucosamine mutase [Actinomycetota bacterium]
MPERPRFGTDGVRGEANHELTPDVALALARATAALLVPPQDDPGVRRRVLIGRDTRQSGPMLEAALVAGYAASGVDVELLGEVPTPAVAWVSAVEGVAAAMISASHNPFADNGIKFFAPGGHKLADDVEDRIETLFHALLEGASPDSDAVTGAAIGRVRASDRALGWADAVVASAEGRRFDGLTVVLDCAHGAASAWAPDIFERLGASVEVIGARPDGVNINEGFGSTHPERLAESVVAANAALGLAFDGDADRLIAIDDSGRVVDGDHVLAILARDWKSTGRLVDDTVVVTVMSNLGFRLAMADADITVVETGIGDRYVLEALNGGRFSLGGEQSGHVICRDLATTGDGVLAGVQLVDSVLRSGRSLADLSDAAMTTLPQVLKNVRLAARDPQIAARLAPAISEVEAEMGGQGRVLVRPSGTEPLVRIMVEHPIAATAEAMCNRLVSTAEHLLGH